MRRPGANSSHTEPVQDAILYRSNTFRDLKGLATLLPVWQIHIQQVHLNRFITKPVDIVNKVPQVGAAVMGLTDGQRGNLKDSHGIWERVTEPLPTVKPTLPLVNFYTEAFLDMLGPDNVSKYEKQLSSM